MSAFKVVGIGELLWDFLPTGSQLGGAPCNLAFHAHALGDKGIIVSRVGQDALGSTALNMLASAGLDVSHVQRDADAPTGTVLVSLDRHRHPNFTITPDVAWDRLRWTDDLLGVASAADAVCFGTLAQRSPASREAIRAFIGATNKDCLIAFDVNLRQFYYTQEMIVSSLELADFCKMNEKELPAVAAALKIPITNVADTAQRIVDAFDLRCLAVTRGEEGSLLVSENEVVEHPGYRVDVQDTVGAGDAFVAGCIHGLLRNMSLAVTSQIAAERGAWVASSRGAMPDPGTFNRKAFV